MFDLERLITDVNTVYRAGMGLEPLKSDGLCPVCRKSYDECECPSEMAVKDE